MSIGRKHHGLDNFRCFDSFLSWRYWSASARKRRIKTETLDRVRQKITKRAHVDKDQSVKACIRHLLTIRTHIELRRVINKTAFSNQSTTLEHQVSPRDSWVVSQIFSWIINNRSYAVLHLWSAVRVISSSVSRRTTVQDLSVRFLDISTNHRCLSIISHHHHRCLNNNINTTSRIKSSRTLLICQQWRTETSTHNTSINSIIFLKIISTWSSTQLNQVPTATTAKHTVRISSISCSVVINDLTNNKRRRINDLGTTEAGEAAAAVAGSIKTDFTIVMKIYRRMFMRRSAPASSETSKTTAVILSMSVRTKKWWIMFQSTTIQTRLLEVRVGSPSEQPSSLPRSSRSKNFQRFPPQRSELQQNPASRALVKSLRRHQSSSQ